MIVLLRHDKVESNKMGDTMRDLRFACLGLMTAAALALAATGATAEGLGDRGSVRDGPYAGPLSWTGFYASAAVGYGTGTTELGDPFQTDVSLRGMQGAVSAGYDFQFSHRWVLGVFLDYSFGEIDGTFDTIAKLAIDKQWAIGGRLGLLATPSTLLYTSAGYTRADFEASQSGVTIADETLDGFFAGLGIEQAINHNLSVKLDYRFSDYEDIAVNGSTNFDNEVHSVRLGVNWKFHTDHGAQLK
jgi:outer membrane immunogenic protein